MKKKKTKILCQLILQIQFIHCNNNCFHIYLAINLYPEIVNPDIYQSRFVILFFNFY